MRPCRPTAGSAPSCLDASPRSHCSWSSTNISQLHLPGPREWAGGSSQLEFDQHLTTACPLVTRAVPRWLCVDQHRTTVCTSHISAFPEKKENSASMSPDMPSSENTTAYRTCLLGPLSHTGLHFLLHVEGPFLQPPDLQGKDDPTRQEGQDPQDRDKQLTSTENTRFL